MSAQGTRRQSADPLEVYDTPAFATWALLSRQPWILLGRQIIEPCAGSGAIVRVLERAGCMVRAFDIAPRVESRPPLFDVDAVPVAVPADATDADWWRSLVPVIATAPEMAPVVVTNPPFSKASLILRLARERGLPVAMLLRITAMEPTEDRIQWLTDDPPTSLVLMPRFSFIGTEGHDMAACAWFCWRLPTANKDGLTRVQTVSRAELDQFNRANYA